MRENTETVYNLIGKEKSDNFMTENERIHYFGFCAFDHSDCPYDHCLYQHLRSEGRNDELKELLNRKEQNAD